MVSTDGAQYAAICKYCGATVARAARIGDAEAAAMNAHLRVTHPQEYTRSTRSSVSPEAASSEDLSFSEILRHFTMSGRP